MRPTSSLRGSMVLTVQALTVVIAPLALFLVPPAHGAMLLVPLGRADTVRFAIAHHAAVIGRGPIAGSILVDGDRSELVRNPLMSGVIALAGRAALCGTITDKAR